MSTFDNAIRRAYNNLGERRFAGICGVCPEFPCHLLLLFSAHDGNPGERLVSAAMRAALGDEAWAEWAGQHPSGDILCPLQPRKR